MRFAKRFGMGVATAGAVLGAAVSPVVAQVAPQLPSTVYIWPMGNTSQNAMMSSLAGVVNRTTNGEVLLSPNVGTQPNPRYWLDQLKLAYPQVQSQVQSSPSFFINKYKSKLSGYVLYDPNANADSINIATSIAGVTNAIIVDPSQQLTAVLSGLTQVADARSMTYASAWQQYGSQFNRDMLFHQDTYFDHQLRDYAVMNKGFTFFSNPTSLGVYASQQNPQARVFGWANSEVDLFAQASQNNQQVVASNHNWSSSATSQWKVPLANQKSHPAGSVVTKTGKHYVSFVMSDGDNATWLTNGMGTDPKYFGSQHRGKFNMSWDFTPSLADMNPVAHNFFYQQASDGTGVGKPGRDTFVAAGGAGTAFPSQTPDIQGLAKSINDSMAKAGLHVTSILDTSYIVSNKLEVILNQPQVDGIMYKTYDNYYKGRNGAITWRNGKPIVGVRYSLWDGADTANSIAAALNGTGNRDAIDNAASYSIVNVHPWSTAGPSGTGTGDPMSNLWALVQQLDPNKVEIVGLEELIVHLRNHFGTPLPGATVNATWTRDANSNWGTTRANWTGAMPNFPDATVNFLGAITAPRTVTMAAPASAGVINFGSTFSYTIAGTSAITLDTTSGAPVAINVTAGNHTISAPLAFADDGVINVAAGGSLTVSNLQSTSHTLTKTGGGAAIVNSVRAAELRVDSGEIATNAGTSEVGALSIASGAKLNVADQELIVRDESLATVEAMIRRGHHGGAWDGDGIVTRLPAAISGLTTLGVATAEMSGRTNFGGVSVGGDDVLVMYTYAGDANLDGFISGDDYTAIDFNISNAGASGYANGDFNYDGIISGDDYATIDFNIVAQGTPFPTGFTPGLTAVPEPAGVAVISLLATVLSGRRRHRSPS